MKHLYTGIVYLFALSYIHELQPSNTSLRGNMTKQSPSYVYIMANIINTVLYVGVSTELVGRVYKHRNLLIKGFTKRYNVTKLIYFEVFSDVVSAIAQEKQLKGGSRRQKLELIESVNPTFRDLYDEIAD